MTFLPRNNLLAAFLIFCGGLLLFTIALGHQEIIGFESRFYLFALSMWRHGPSWFPAIGEVPYPDYPATSTLFIYGFAKLIGHLSKWTAVFPSAAAAAITLATTYLIGALQSRLWGWYAVCLLILTNTFLTEARTISPDQYITMVTTLIFYLAASAQLFKKPGRLWFVPLLLLLGFACRGPIGLVIPAGVLCVFYLVDNDYRKFFCAAFSSIILLAMGCGLLYWLALKAGGTGFAQDVIQGQVAGRLTLSTLPWYFYFTESIGAYAITYPLALLMLIGALYNLKKIVRQNFLLKLIDWSLVILIGMSIPAGKKIRYVLACAPALALICAYLFAEPQKQKHLLLLRRAAYWFCYFLPMVCFVATLAVEIVGLQQHWHTQILLPAIFALFLVLQWLCWLTRTNPAGTMGIAALSFVMAYIFLIEPINLMLNHTHNFVMNVEVMRKHEHAQLGFYQENPDGLPIKYLVNMPAEEMINYLDQPAQLAGINTHAFFIASPENYAKIPQGVLHAMTIVATGNVGHDPVVVFTQRKN
ncbi:MAG: glycosyltransferase family 39 protein [Pseudomonadota bacterium]